MNFVYLLGWSHLDKWYYGVRYGKSAHPSSIGTTYFSSSEYVKRYIEENGLPDVAVVRQEFMTGKAAKSWEERVIRRMSAVSSNRWLNCANNNAFKGIVMDTAVKTAISKSRSGKPMGNFYTNGTVTKRFVSESDVPSGWKRGRVFSPAQLAHHARLNTLVTPEMRSAIGKAAGDKTRGVAKPAGFGEKVSQRLSGVARPCQTGDNNPARRAESREKISASKRGCKHFTDGTTLIFVRPEHAPVGWVATSIWAHRNANTQ